MRQQLISKLAHSRSTRNGTCSWRCHVMAIEVDGILSLSSTQMDTIQTDARKLPHHITDSNQHAVRITIRLQPHQTLRHRPTYRTTTQNTRQCATAHPAEPARAVLSSSSNPKAPHPDLNSSVSFPLDSPPAQRTRTRQQLSKDSTPAFQVATL